MNTPTDFVKQLRKEFHAVCDEEGPDLKSHEVKNLFDSAVLDTILEITNKPVTRTLDHQGPALPQ